MIKKKHLLIITVLLISLSIIAISSTAQAPGVNNFQILNVAVDPSLPPFQFWKDGKLSGLNIDILNSIGEKNNLKINYIPINKDVAIEKLLREEIDMVLGIRYNAGLSEKIDYTESVVQSVICMVVKSENQKDIQANLNSSTYLASVENNSTELNFLSNLRRINFNVAFNQEDAFELLLMKRADFLLGVKDTVEFLLAKHKLTREYTIIDSYITPVEYLVAIKAGNTSLTNLINNGISRLKISGEYEELYNKWVENSELNIARRLRNIIWTSVIVGITLGVIFLIGIMWSINLKKLVNIKTKELVKINMDLEAQIIETKNNIELKNLIGESSPRGIVIFDKEGIISMFNTSALNMTSLDKPPIGKSVYNIELLNLMLKDTVNIVLKHNTSYTCDEFKYNKDNKELIYRYVMYPLHDFEDKIRGIIITIEDITEETKLREQMIEKNKNKALTQIIAGISHEIRNPLTTIKTFVELIPKKIDNKKFREELSTIVPEEIKRVDNLIGSLIDYAKPRAQNKSTFDLNEVLNSSISLFNPVFEDNHIEVSVIIEDDLYVYCDSSQIKQVIINFLLNSIDAVLEKKDIVENNNYQGRINIKGHQNGDSILLVIEDNGIGMDKSEIEKAYDIFYTTKERGTGLGFPLSIQMLHANGCKVSVESDKNKFTRISLEFPKSTQNIRKESL